MSVDIEDCAEPWCVKEHSFLGQRSNWRWRSWRDWILQCRSEGLLLSWTKFVAIVRSGLRLPHATEAFLDPSSMGFKVVPGRHLSSVALVLAILKCERWRGGKISRVSVLPCVVSWCQIHFCWIGQPLTKRRICGRCGRSWVRHQRWSLTWISPQIASDLSAECWCLPHSLGQTIWLACFWQLQWRLDTTCRYCISCPLHCDARLVVFRCLCGRPWIFVVRVVPSHRGWHWHASAVSSCVASSSKV